MFSIIVCSIRPDEAERLRKNIEATIGVPFEFIAYDNCGTGKGICQVYNECAANARYDNLCFVHEDVEFATENWGKSIAGKLSEKDCGVIGFAGSTIKPKAYSGWSSSSHSTIRTNYIHLYKGKEHLRNSNPLGEDFSEVIAIDGLCLFCRKDTWQTIRFDDILLKAFHCYDIDFAIANKVAGNKNYVCHTVRVKHFSNGNYDMNWWRESKKMHKKWEKHLPLYIERPSELRKKYIEYKSNIEITHTLGKNGIFVGNPQKYIMGYIATHPFNGRSYRLLGKYFRHLRTKQK